jgi:uncharacterized protein (DUF2235 family)
MSEPKRLVICADGTWNDEDGGGAPTNVVRLHHAVQTHYVEGVNQWVYYHSGVGTVWTQRLTGGAFGYGINRNILDCYRFLVENYREGDEIFLCGFSRGAYTVRSLAGLIRNSGIVKDPADIARAFALYRDRAPEAHPSSERARTFRLNRGKSTPRLAHAIGSDDYINSPEIQFIGVWDTVGSLGYPLPFFPLWKHLLPLLGVNWWFHDTDLSTTVRHAYHAVAIHERRSDFPPTLWNLQTTNGQPKRSDQILEQVYFPGVHCDVGGGYGGAALSDIAFRWLAKKASDAGLLLRPGALEAGTVLAPDPLGRLHDSFTGLFAAADAVRLRPHGLPRIFEGDPGYNTRIADSATDLFTRQPATPWPERGGEESLEFHVRAAVDDPTLRAPVLECLRSFVSRPSPVRYP